MKILTRNLFGIIFSFIFAVTPTLAATPRYVEGEAIVALRGSSLNSSGAASAMSLAAKSSDSLASSLGAEVVYNFRPVQGEAPSSTASGFASALSVSRQSSASQESYAVAHLRSSSGESTEEFIARLRENPNVVSATPNYIKTLSYAGNKKKSSGADSSTFTPNDPRYGEQWGMERIGMPEVWAATMEAESEEVVVAVIDTGIIYDHPDLEDKMYTFNDLSVLNKIASTHDDDLDSEAFVGSHGAWFFSRGKGKYYVDDDYEDLTPVYSPIGPGSTGDAEFSDLDNLENYDKLRYIGDIGGHGTHVAGIIGAATNNGIGVAGVAQNVKLMAVGVFSLYKYKDDYNKDDYNYVALNSDTMRGIDWVLAAKDAGVNIRVVNMSLGGWADEEDGCESSPYALKIKALSDAGIIVCLAAGNEYQDLDAPEGEDYQGQINVPAMYRFDNTITIGASTANDKAAGFSNYSSSGKWVDIFAPGDYILSTCRYEKFASENNDTFNSYGYTSISGTSMAAPHVAGVAAQLCSLYPDMSATAIKQIILDGADSTVLKDGYSAYGRLDAYESLNLGVKRASVSSSGGGGGCSAGASALALLAIPAIYALFGVRRGKDKF